MVVKNKFCSGKMFKQLVVAMLLLHVIVVATFAQDGMGKVNTGRPSRWSIGIMGSPDWEGRFFKAERKESYDGLGVSDNKDQNAALCKLMKANEYAGFSYTAGLHFQYDLSKRWFARLGVYYSNKAIRARAFVSAFDSLPGHAIVPFIKTKSNFPFIEIPLTFHYMLNRPFDKSKKGTCYTDYSQYNRKKPLFYVFIGPAYSTNLKLHDYTSRRFTALDTDTTNTVYVNKFTLHHAGIYAGVGLMKYFNQHLCLTADATFRYFPARWYSKKFDNNIDPNTGLRTAVSYHVVDKPWSVGLQIGLNYHF
jgi:hypothetical protein